MKLRTLVIDDEPIALQKLASYVARVPYLELEAQCTSAAEALSILAERGADLIFTDISMPGLSGLEFVSSLSRPVMVVFTTAHEQYALDSYRIGAVDYLLKPYTFVDFQRAANRAHARASALASIETHQEPQESSIFVKVDARHVRVAVGDIRYIKSFGNYLQIYVDGGEKPLLTLSPFAPLKEKLTHDFIQIHRSYVVNMNKVEQIERNRIVMDSETYLPVSESFRSDLQNYLTTRAVGRSGTKSQ